MRVEGFAGPVNGGLVGRSRRRGWRALVFAVAAGLSALWALALAGSAVAAPTAIAFTTQGCTTWTVPAGVSSVQIQATGALGGDGQKGSPTGPVVVGVGGKGDGVSGTLSGLAGGSQTLYVCVDQGGGLGFSPVPNFGYGGNGGGASGVSLGPDFNSPVLVAGGGGGGGGVGVSSNGGAGGSAGMPVAHPGVTAADGGGGAGGNNSTNTGGTAGVNSVNPLGNGQAGGRFALDGPGPGGAGGDAGPAGGGGGGAGYFGGGGGASGQSGGGAGGGTDFCATSITGCTVSSGAGTQTTAGSGAGFARVTITYS